MAQSKKPTKEVVKVKKAPKAKKAAYSLTKDDVCWLVWHKQWRKNHAHIQYKRGKETGFPDPNYRPNLLKLFTPV